MRNLPISITCECGESNFVPYGEKWTCGNCGRTWNTAQIPADEYRQFLRDIRRPRIWAAVVALTIAGALAIVALIVNPAMLIVIPILIGGVAILAGPPWKKIVRRRIAERPRWELHPE